MRHVMSVYEGLLQGILLFSESTFKKLRFLLGFCQCFPRSFGGPICWKLRSEPFEAFTGFEFVIFGALKEARSIS